MKLLLCLIKGKRKKAGLHNPAFFCNIMPKYLIKMLA